MNSALRIFPGEIWQSRRRPSKAVYPCLRKARRGYTQGLVSEKAIRDQQFAVGAADKGREGAVELVILVDDNIV